LLSTPEVRLRDVDEEASHILLVRVQSDDAILAGIEPLRIHRQAVAVVSEVGLKLWLAKARRGGGIDHFVKTGVLSSGPELIERRFRSSGRNQTRRLQAISRVRVFH